MHYFGCALGGAKTIIFKAPLSWWDNLKGGDAMSDEHCATVVGSWLVGIKNSNAGRILDCIKSKLLPLNFPPNCYHGMYYKGEGSRHGVSCPPIVYHSHARLSGLL